jgi:hypothetical protein
MSRQRTHCIYHKCAIQNYEELVNSVDGDLVSLVIDKNFLSKFNNNTVTNPQYIDKPMKIPKFKGSLKDYPTKNQKVNFL